MKVCSKCNELKDFTDFNQRRRYKDGLDYFCRKCRKVVANHNWHKNKKQRAAGKKKIRCYLHDWLVSYLCDHPCIDCGESDFRVLEFDHVRGRKSRKIGDMLASGISKPKIEEEIAKCDIRCANCHRRRTLMQKNNWRQSAWDRLYKQ